jgi:hypothetical protein
MAIQRATGRRDPVEGCVWCQGAGKRGVRHSGTGETHGAPCPCTYELPVAWVPQAESKGCMLAATAMLVGKTYKEIRALVTGAWDFTEAGTNIGVVHALLDQLGFAYQTRYQYDARLDLRRPEWPCAPWADRILCEVRNLSETGYHAVILLRDGRVLDPWWGVLQGLHRYSHVQSMTAVYPVPPALVADAPAVETIEPVEA